MEVGMKIFPMLVKILCLWGIFCTLTDSVHGQTTMYGREGGKITLVCPLIPNGKLLTWTGPPGSNAYFYDETKNPNAARGERLSVVRNNITEGYNLQITGLTREEDFGDYKCDITTGSELKQHIIHLDLYLSPSNISIDGSFTENGILRISGTENSGLTLICRSTGGVPLANVTWKRGSQILSSGISQVSYTLTASRNDDLKTYMCESNSPALTNSMMKDVQIYLKLMPQKPIVPPIPVIKENQQLTVSCSSSGSRPAATLSWRFRGSAVPVATDPPPVLDSVTQTYNVSSTRRVIVNRGDNGRDVTCIASNIALSAGTLTMRTVFVHFGPDRVIFDGSTGLQENKTMNLRCITDDSNNASVLSWKNNSSPLFVNTQVSTSAGINNGVRAYQTYTKELSRHDHRSVITCTASNGDITSTNSATLDVKYSPRVSLSPSSLITVVGQKDITLHCTLLEANPQQVTYYWKPAGSTSNVFKITQITKAHERQYECEAGNSAGRSPVARAQITVQYSPEIEPFTPRTPEEIRDSVLVRCNATANPSVNRTYWTYPNGTIASNSKILQINNIRRDQKGVYTCHAENTLTPTGQQPYSGRGQQNLTVDVLYGPSPENTTTNSTNIMRYEESDSATFPSIICNSVCNPECVLIWNGQHPSSSGVLNLGQIKRDRNGTYTCTARNIVNSFPRSASTTIHVFVLYPPSLNITIDNGINTVNEGDRVQMTCTVDSQPYSNVTWDYKGERLSHQDTGVAYSQLVLNSAQCYDTGNFSCHAENGIGSLAKMTTSLKVKCDPRPLNGESFVHKGIPENEGLQITAKFTAYPRPPITWVFKREGMNKTEAIPVTSYTTMNLNESLIQSTLVINNVSLSEYGNYTAVANAAKITFIVGPQRKPFAPKDVIISCGIQDATVIWTSNLNGGSTQNFSIKYKSLKDKNFEEYKKVTLDQGKGHKMNVTVDGLAQASEYVFIVIARNNFGATYSTEMPNCTTGYIKDQTGSSEALIGGLGGGIGVILALIVVVIVILSRRGKPFGKKSKRTSESRSALNENEDEDGLKDNILYESAGPREQGVSGVSVAPVYAEVRKKEQLQNDTNANIYAKVDKEATTQQKQVVKKGKDKEQKMKGKKGKKDKQKKVQNMDVYENAEDMAMKTIDKDNVYSNSDEAALTTPERGYKNQDGLLYVEVQFNPEKQQGKPVIHGEDEKTDYATVEFSTPESRPAP